jgi:purine-binding chemotaxis protein CheW
MVFVPARSTYKLLYRNWGLIPTLCRKGTDKGRTTQTRVTRHETTQNGIYEEKIVMENSLIQEEDTQHGRFLTFVLANEVYGLDIRYVTSIIGLQPIATIPEVPDYVKGIINLRGKIIPVIDVRLKFRKEPAAYTDRTWIIVIDIQDTTIGLIVDRVAEVLTIDDSNIVPPPDQRSGAQNRYINAIGMVGNDIKLLLDCNKLFSSSELDSLINIG